MAPTDRSIDLMSVVAANPRAICTTFCPEVYQYPKAVAGAADNVTLTSTTAEYDVVTDANGNCGMYFNMHALLSTGAGTTAWYGATTKNYATT